MTSYDGTPGVLVKAGNGVMVLSGFNTYTSGTTVLDGTLIIAGSDSLLDGTSLTVGTDAMSIFDPSAAAALGVDTASPASVVSAVPEPGTALLLIVALGGAAWARCGHGYRRFGAVKKDLKSEI